MGIRIGEAETGWVKEFIRFPWANPNILPGNGAEFVTVDIDGNIYGGEPVPSPTLMTGLSGSTCGSGHEGAKKPYL